MLSTPDTSPRESRFRSLYAGSAAGLGEWHCCAPAGGVGHPEHSERYEIAVQRRGFYRKHVGTRVVTADVNHAVFFHRDEEYRVSHPVAGGDCCTLLTPSEEDIAELGGRLVRGGGDRIDRLFAAHRVWLDQPTYAVHSLLLRAVRDGRAADDGLEVEELLWWLLERIIGAAATEVDGARPLEPRPWMHAKAVDLVKAYLAEHFQRAVALEEISAQTPYSTFHLCRIFRDVTGVPIHRYLLEIRLRAALERLPAYDGQLSHLAHQIGFSSHSHFTRAFRRAFGVPPSAARSTRVLKRIRATAPPLAGARGRPAGPRA